MDLKKIDNLRCTLAETEDEYAVLITNKKTIDAILGEEELPEGQPDVRTHKLRGVFRGGISIFFIDKEDISIEMLSKLIER